MNTCMTIILTLTVASSSIAQPNAATEPTVTDTAAIQSTTDEAAASIEDTFDGYKGTYATENISGKGQTYYKSCLEEGGLILFAKPDGLTADRAYMGWDGKSALLADGLDANGNYTCFDFYGNTHSIPHTASYHALKITGVRHDIEAICQRPELIYGCEITAATMMLRYSGADVTKQQLDSEMPVHSWDVNKGFVGSTSGNTESTINTINPAALVELTSKYAGKGKNITGCGAQALKAYLLAGAAPVVWMRSMHGYETHALTLTGFDGDGFFYNDPWTGEKDVFMDYNTFAGKWNGQRQKALTCQPEV